MASSQAVKQAEEAWSHAVQTEATRLFSQVPIPSTPKAPATLRCLETTALKRFGKLRGWEVQTESAGVFMELLVLRPILVGWKQGNSNSYYKILGQEPSHPKPYRRFKQVVLRPRHFWTYMGESNIQVRANPSSVFPDNNTEPLSQFLSHAILFKQCRRCTTN